MNNQELADNPHYEQYESLLVELHRLLADGRGESPEADAIRDRMDWAADELSPGEIARLKGLSADLYRSYDHETSDRGHGPGSGDGKLQHAAA